MNYFLHLLVMINLYGLLALSLNLVVGYTGLLSLCHAAFFGIGAYATTILMMDVGLGFFPALLAAVGLTIILSLVIGVPSLRLRGDYFILATLSFQIIVFSILYNWVDLTRGPYGIPGIPIPTIFSWPINTPYRYFWFSLSGCGIFSLLIWTLSASPFGRVLKAVREDEIAAAALGKSLPALKITAFALSAGFAAIPGAFFAGYLRYIDPMSFTMMDSVFMVAIVAIGGAGTFVGPLAGTVLLIFLPEALRFLQIPDALAANFRQILYGLLLILLMRYRPQGFFGEFKFD